MKVFRTESDGDVYGTIVSLLRDGGIIAYPTDTSYGLGGDPFNDSAIERIFKMKGRPEAKPILLLVDAVVTAEQVIQPTEVFYQVVEKFWPGPLTIITHAKSSLPSKVTAGTNTIGVRWPIAPFATTLVSRFGKPLTATSANRTGMPSAVTADEVRHQLGESIDALVDGGMLPARGGSTLLDVSLDPPELLREGPLPFDALAEFFNGRIRRRVA